MKQIIILASLNIVLEGFSHPKAIMKLFMFSGSISVKLPAHTCRYGFFYINKPPANKY